MSNISLVLSNKLPAEQVNIIRQVVRAAESHQLRYSSPTNSSGLPVPKATTVKPTTNGVTPKRSANAELPRTRPSAPVAKQHQAAKHKK
jgi:hypothetical protein